MEGQGNRTIMKIMYSSPGIVKKIFPRTIWKSKKNKILLSFDDGPTEAATVKILDKLDKLNIKAIFFCVGNNITKHPDLAEEIVKRGHTLGNHTQNHARITKLNKSKVFLEIKDCSICAQEKVNYTPKYFRSPYGRFSFSTQRILNNLNMENVMWSLLTHDYENDINIVKFALKNYLEQDSIVVFHDSEKSVEIISESINYAVEITRMKNFKIGTPAECLS